MCQATRNLGTFVYVPIIAVGLGHPDFGSIAHYFKIGTNAGRIVETEHCDVHAVNVDIAGRRQGCVAVGYSCGGQYVDVSDLVTFCPEIVQLHSLIGLTGLPWLNDLHCAGITGQECFVESYFKPTAIGIGSIGTSQYAPVFVDAILCCQWVKVDLGEKICGLRGTFGLNKLLIQIDLAGVIQVQIYHVLTWSETNQTKCQQIVVEIEIGSLGVVAVGQLICLGGQILQQTLLNTIVVAFEPVCVFELVFGWYYGGSLPEVVFVRNYLSTCVPDVGPPGLHIVLVKYESLCIDSAVPLCGHGRRQAQSALSFSCVTVVDQIIEYGPVV